MFYSSSLLSKKGALGTIWIASHLDKRLKRSQIFDTSIPASVGKHGLPPSLCIPPASGRLLPLLAVVELVGHPNHPAAYRTPASTACRLHHQPRGPAGVAPVRPAAAGHCEGVPAQAGVFEQGRAERL